MTFIVRPVVQLQSFVVHRTPDSLVIILRRSSYAWQFSYNSSLFIVRLGIQLQPIVVHRTPDSSITAIRR